MERFAVARAVGLWLLPLAATTGCIVSPDDEAEVLDTTELGVGPAPDGGYTFGRSAHELRKSVPISNGAAEWRVIYSVPLSDLGPQERVAVRGEVQLTTCQKSDVDQNTPCQRISPFNPKFQVKVVLGSSKGDSSGKALSETSGVTCTHFEHHCAVAIKQEVTDGLAGSKFANLVVAASAGGATSKDVMIVDEDHGGLYVTRIGAGAEVHGKQFDGTDVSPAWMKLDMANEHPREPHVTLQATVANAQPGDILDVDALIEAKTHGQGSKPAGCQGAREPLLSHQVFVSKHKQDPIASKIAAITAKNGSNCDLDDTCKYRKSGAIQLPEDTPDTVHVSVVSWGGRSCSASGDEWKLGGASWLRVGRLR